MPHLILASGRHIHLVATEPAAKAAAKPAAKKRAHVAADSPPSPAPPAASPIAGALAMILAILIASPATAQCCNGICQIPMPAAPWPTATDQTIMRPQPMPSQAMPYEMLPAPTPYAQPYDPYSVAYAQRIAQEQLAERIALEQFMYNRAMAQQYRIPYGPGPIGLFPRIFRGLFGPPTAAKARMR